MSNGKPSLKSRLMEQLNLRHWLRVLLQIDDSPHAIALGSAVGLFVGITPTVGCQIAVVLLVAFLTRRLFYFNRFAGALGTYVSNPLTSIPLYWVCYQVGALFSDEKITMAEFTRILEYNNFEEWKQTVVEIFVSIGVPLLIGCTIVGLAVAIPSYFIVKRLVERFQQKQLPPSGDPNNDAHQAELQVAEAGSSKE